LTSRVRDPDSSSTLRLSSACVGDSSHLVNAAWPPASALSPYTLKIVNGKATAATAIALGPVSMSQSPIRKVTVPGGRPAAKKIGTTMSRAPKNSMASARRSAKNSTEPRQTV
jgi:hypothetical protein